VIIQIIFVGALRHIYVNTLCFFQARYSIHTILKFSSLLLIFIQCSHLAELILNFQHKKGETIFAFLNKQVNNTNSKYLTLQIQ